MEAYYQSIINGGYKGPFYEEEPQRTQARSTQDVARRNSAGMGEHVGTPENEGMGDEGRNEEYGGRRVRMAGYWATDEAMGGYEGEDEGESGYGRDKDMGASESGKYHNHDEYGVRGNFNWGDQHRTFDYNRQSRAVHGLPAGQEAGQRPHTHVGPYVCLANLHFVTTCWGRDTVLSTHMVNLFRLCKGLVLST